MKRLTAEDIRKLVAEAGQRKRSRYRSYEPRLRQLLAAGKSEDWQKFDDIYRSLRYDASMHPETIDGWLRKHGLITVEGNETVMDPNTLQRKVDSHLDEFVDMGEAWEAIDIDAREIAAELADYGEGFEYFHHHREAFGQLVAAVERWQKTH